MDSRRLNLAFIDPGRRKAPFYLELRHRLEPRVHCLYWSQRIIVRGFVRCAGAPLFPRSPASSREFDISDHELAIAIGRKEMALRGPKLMKRARRLLHELSDFLESQNVGAIFVWNGSNLRLALAVWLARKRGIPVIFAEHGYLPGTTQIDSRGVNFDSSMTDLVMSGAGQLAPDPVLDAALDREIDAYKNGRPMRVMNAPAPAHYRSDLRSWLYRKIALWIKERDRRNPPAVGCDEPALPERFVLLPFQVTKDSQLILHSPLVGKDMAGMLSAVHAALAGVDPRMRIVVKLHPYERRDVQMRYADLIRQYPDVLFIRRHRMTELLARSSAVVTVNSTVGFEAFLFDKPVVALGRNFFTAQGLVEKVDRLEQLPDALTRALHRPVDKQRRRAFLRFAIDRFLTFGSYHDFSEASLGAVAERMLALLFPARADEAERTLPAVHSASERPYATAQGAVGVVEIV